MKLQCEHCYRTYDDSSMKCECGKEYSRSDIQRQVIELGLNRIHMIALKNIASYMNCEYNDVFLRKMILQGLKAVIDEYKDIDFYKECDIFNAEKEIKEFELQSVPKGVYLTSSVINNDYKYSTEHLKEFVIYIEAEIGKNVLHRGV